MSYQNLADSACEMWNGYSIQVDVEIAVLVPQCKSEMIRFSLVELYFSISGRLIYFVQWDLYFVDWFRLWFVYCHCRFVIWDGSNEWIFRYGDISSVYRKLERFYNASLWYSCQYWMIIRVGFSIGFIRFINNFSNIFDIVGSISDVGL